MMPWYFIILGVFIGTLTLMFSLLVFLGEPANPFRQGRPFRVVVVCAGISFVVMLLGLMAFPVGWLLANMASFIGIKAGFALPFWLACFIFLVNFVLFQSFVWLIVPVLF